MSSKVKLILNTGRYPHPAYVKETQYEVITGSQAYGTNTEDSDFDIYSFCIPPKHVIFPATDGIIAGFGYQGEKFDEFSEQHIHLNGQEFDVRVYSIIKFFDLCMDNNPNILDTLFVHPNCILHKTIIGDMVRDARHQFVHKGCWHRFKGYAFSQLNKVKNKKPVGKRVAIVDKYGYDVKFASHIVRLLDECEQLLETGTMDMHRSKEHQKAIRRGDVPFEDIEKWYYDRLPILEKLYESSKLPYCADEGRIKGLLINCLEHHFGKMENLNNFGISLDTELQKIEDALNAIRLKMRHE